MSFFIGKALRVNTGAATGAETNQAAGHCAGASMTTGAFNNVFGVNAGRCITTGSCNNFIGFRASCGTTTGNRNVTIGSSAGPTGVFGGSTGTYNVLIGHSAGSYIFGNCNTVIGTFADALGNGSGNNNTMIGHCSFAGPEVSNRVAIGNSNINCAMIQVGWTTMSDIRDKCVFGNVKHGRGFLKKLNPIEFAFKDRDFDDITDPLGKTRYGFSAQEVLAAEGDHPVIVSTENPTKLQMTNDYLIPVLVNAIKELTADVEDLQTRLTALETQ